jgi:hypothetical protein
MKKERGPRSFFVLGSTFSENCMILGAAAHPEN